MPGGARSGATKVSASSELADDETRQHLQRRLCLVFMVLSGVSAFYALSPFVAAFAAKQVIAQSLWIPVSTFVIALGNGAFALRCYRGKRGFAELWVLDATASAFTCWMIAASLTQVRPPNEASISLLLGVTYVMMARALMLPSSTSRTVFVCALGLAPAGAVATWLRVGALAEPPMLQAWLSHGYVVFRNCAVTTFLAALASSVIYGLRRRVGELARVGQYVLREKVGQGGMGVVYRATHALLRRDTAVKLLLPTRISPEALLRFEQEVKFTAQLTHQNTVVVFDYGRTPGGVFYYAMEYLEGGDLEELVAYSGPLEPARAIWLLEQVCRALSEAHGRGLVHRDVKPSNVIVCERGQEGDVAKVLDFGLVMDLKAQQAAPQSAALVGTPLYIAPESITSPADVDARSDLYSLGGVAYFLLTGEPPFIGANIVEVCAAHLDTAPRLPSEKSPRVSPALDAVVLRCLAKEPVVRFQSALELREALLACPEASAWDSRAASYWWQAHRERFRSAARTRNHAPSAEFTAPLAAETEGALRIDLAGRADNP